MYTLVVRFAEPALPASPLATEPRIVPAPVHAPESLWHRYRARRQHERAAKITTMPGAEMVLRDAARDRFVVDTRWGGRRYRGLSPPCFRLP
jgi:hypothetical protein